MPSYLRHVFICTNRRDPGNTKGDCASKGGEEVQQKFKQELHKRNLRGAMRANSAGCLDTCPFGVSVVVYPEGTWYSGVTPEDVVQIVDEHLIGGRPVTRLLMAGTPPKSKTDPGL